MALHGALGDIFNDFGGETITRGKHLEKLCLIQPGVGRDNISDFTTNLIKGFLCRYTQTLARAQLDKKQCAEFAVPRAEFNYTTRTWVTKRYYLPELRGDFVLLTPTDLLTRDETWINYPDMEARFNRLPEAVPDAQQRALINQYFESLLGREPTKEQERAAILATLRKFPDLIDRYIRLKEDDGDRAEATSNEKVEFTQQELVLQIQQAVGKLAQGTDFYDKPWTSYDECLKRVKLFKHYIENQDGYRLLNGGGQGYSRESEVQLAFGLVWLGSDFDLNRETNNGRGPVDFKASFGSGDKSLIEFKLASNTQLKRNLEKQVQIYEAANRTRTSVKAIVFYTAQQEARARKILQELELENEKSIVLIDVRSDNKPSASKA